MRSLLGIPGIVASIVAILTVAAALLAAAAKFVSGLTGLSAERRALRIERLACQQEAKDATRLMEAKMEISPFAPVTPGEMLKEEFLEEYGLSQNQLAKAIGISPNRIAEIVNNRRRITADTALRLSLYFGNSPEFWLNLQTNFDLKTARQKLDPKDAQRIKSNRAA
jgi:addiction module HigA family antidote